MRCYRSIYLPGVLRITTNYLIRNSRSKVRNPVPPEYKFKLLPTLSSQCEAPINIYNLKELWAPETAFFFYGYQRSSLIKIQLIILWSHFKLSKRHRLWDLVFNHQISRSSVQQITRAYICMLKAGEPNVLPSDILQRLMYLTRNLSCTNHCI
jgi:hypothetical protein